jgi:hypothetical protein
MNLEGEIGEFNLIERLVELGREQFTGAIRFENDGIIKIIYFKGGDILSASTNDRADSIDEILMRANKVSRDHVKQALAKRKETETLGDALLNLGFITRKELTWARRVQVIGVIRSIIAWSAGSYTIVADYLPKREEGTLFPLAQIITELIVTDNDRAKFDRAMDGGNAVFVRAIDFDDMFRRLGLNEDAAVIAENVDGVNNASEVAMLSGKDAFNVYKLLHALVTLGMLTRSEKPQVQAEGWVPQVGGEDFNFADAGVADAADVWGEPAPAPPPEPEPEFESEPATMEMPAVAAAPKYEEPEWSLAPEPEPEPAEMAAPPASAMPSWEPIVPAAVEPLRPENSEPEEQWGFDEAQIEAAQRGAAIRGEEDVMAEDDQDVPPPVRRAPREHGRAWRAVVTLLLIALLGAGGYLGWIWWQERQSAQAEAAVLSRPAAPTKLTPPPVPAVVPVTGSTATLYPPGSTTESPATPMTVAASAPTPSTGGMTITPPVAPPPTATTASAPPPTAVASTKTPPTPATATSARLERTTSGTTITNSTSPTVGTISPNADAQRKIYDAMAEQFATSAEGEYTIQFELVCETASIAKALREGGHSVWFVPISYRSKPCYRVFWGHYPTVDAAKAALSGIPPSLHAAAPVVVRLARQ